MSSHHDEIERLELSFSKSEGLAYQAFQAVALNGPFIDLLANGHPQAWMAAVTLACKNDEAGVCFSTAGLEDAAEFAAAR